MEDIQISVVKGALLETGLLPQVCTHSAAEVKFASALHCTALLASLPLFYQQEHQAQMLCKRRQRTVGM